MNWEPWDLYCKEYKDVDPEEVLDIKGPPCDACKHWKPKRTYERKKKSTKVTYTGISCCQASEMYCDFSCFETN